MNLSKKCPDLLCCLSALHARRAEKRAKAYQAGYDLGMQLGKSIPESEHAAIAARRKKLQNSRVTGLL